MSSWGLQHWHNVQLSSACFMLAWVGTMHLLLEWVNSTVRAKEKNIKKDSTEYFKDLVEMCSTVVRHSIKWMAEVFSTRAYLQVFPWKKKKLEKMLALSRGKWVTWLSKTWKMLRYSMIFLPWSTLASVLAILSSCRRQRQEMEEGTITHCRRGSASRPSKEPECTHVGGIWWNASKDPKWTGWCSC